MQNINLNTLFRTSFKLDRINSNIESQSLHDNKSLSYPPHNIIHDSDDKYRIVFAVAGFSNEDLEVIVESNTLKIKSLNRNQNSEKYIYKGISSRNFERRFELTDFMEVTDASMQNGLLTIFLHRQIPKDLQPRAIKISLNNDLKNKAA